MSKRTERQARKILKAFKARERKYVKVEIKCLKRVIKFTDDWNLYRLCSNRLSELLDGLKK